MGNDQDIAARFDKIVKQMSDFVFPQTSELANGTVTTPGLSKRELFAAMAMQGWLAGCRNAYSEFTAPGMNTHVAAESAVQFADALLATLTVSRERP